MTEHENICSRSTMTRNIPEKTLESLFGTITELDLSRIHREHEEEKDEE